RCPRHLGTQLGRYAYRLVVLALRHPDERAVVGVGLRIRKRTELVEQASGLLVDEELVREARERCKVVGASLAAGRRHHRLLVPGEEPRDPLQIGDADQPLFELLECVSHAGSLTAGGGGRGGPPPVLLWGRGGALARQPAVGAAAAPWWCGTAPVGVWV